MVEERHAGLEPPRHGHVVHPLDRVVHEHHRRVEAQRPVRGGARGSGEALLHEPERLVAARQPARGQQAGQVLVGAVEEGLPVPLDRAGDVVVGCVGHGRVPVVAGEHLVGALARLHHLHVLGDLLAQEVERHGVVAHHWLAHGGHGGAQRGEHAIGPHADLVVVGGEALRHHVAPAELVAGLAAHRLEAHRERGQAVLAGLGEQANDEAGVEAARQEAAHGHVGHQAPPHRGAQGVEGGVLPVGGRPGVAGRVSLEARLPVAHLAPGPVGLHGQGGAGWELADAVQDRVRCGHHGVEREVVVQRHAVDRGVDAAAGHDRRQGRCEPQPAAHVGEVERLDAEAITAEQQPA
ncbi:MAG: hypothetical protein R2746_01560 [Acidimicrobiales bacterium]